MLCRLVTAVGMGLVLAAGLSATEVVDFTLINAQTDRDIRTLADGDTIDLGVAARLNVRANTRGKVGSVRFALDDNRNFLTENVAPYALQGDRNGDYGVWTPSPGQHVLTATPYTRSGAGGTRGTAKTITFTVVGKPKVGVGPVGTRVSRYADIAGQDELGPISAPVGGQGSVSGELKRWHKVTVDFPGPTSGETAKPNPFLHYRLNVAFRHGDSQYVVPGYFAGDGEGGPDGNTWRVHFAPPTTGAWTYRASFRAGFQVNVDNDPDAGSPTYCDGGSGQFTVAESDQSGADFRAADNGLLRNSGHHYLTFAGSGQPWVKGGPDIPENLLGYDGFDNTPRARHQFAAHAVDWRPGDPDWGNGRGKRIIGAFNYIARQGGNCVYFLPMNIGGDGQDTFPTIGEQEKTRYDNSKLDQWGIVFRHAQSLGVFLHFQLAETESGNEQYHDGGELGVQRKLYYRQMIARFGHHPGLELDLGEENDYGTRRRIAFAAYIKAVDPYDHPVTTHTHGGKYEAFYGPLLGNEDFDVTAFQGGDSNRSMANLIAQWRRRSAESGVKLAISFDEPQKIENDATDEKNGYAHGRRDKMWPAYMSGAAGFEWYVQADGGGHGLDHRLEDFRQMKPALNWAGHATSFLGTLPLLQMAPHHELAGETKSGNTYVLARPGELYALYNDRSGSGLRLDLTGGTGSFRVQWFDPLHGGELLDGSVTTIPGGQVVDLGNAPRETDRDWACLVTKR